MNSFISKKNNTFKLDCNVDLKIEYVDSNKLIVRNNNKKNVYYIALMTYMIIHFFVVQVFRPEWNHLYPYEFWHM